MAKQRMFICHGPHRIMRTQAQVPRGWKQVRAKRLDGTEVLWWYCLKCLPTVTGGTER